MITSKRKTRANCFKFYLLLNLLGPAFFILSEAWTAFSLGSVSSCLASSLLTNGSFLSADSWVELQQFFLNYSDLLHQTGLAGGKHSLRGWGCLICEVDSVCSRCSELPVAWTNLCSLFCRILPYLRYRLASFLKYCILCCGYFIRHLPPSCPSHPTCTWVYCWCDFPGFGKLLSSWSGNIDALGTGLFLSFVQTSWQWTCTRRDTRCPRRITDHIRPFTQFYSLLSSQGSLISGDAMWPHTDLTSVS